METESNVKPPKKAIRRIWKLLFAVVAILIAGNVYGGQWLLYHDKAIKGQVIEADTGNPIEGALVIALWKLTDIVGEGPGGYAKIIVTETDKEGRFEIPPWINFKPWKLIYTTDNLSPYTAIFKPGYMVHSSHRLAFEGFTEDTIMTAEERKLGIEKFGIAPAKLYKIKNDDERMASLDNLSLQADFRNPYYSKEQQNKILRACKNEVDNLSSNNKRKSELLKNYVNGALK